MSGHNAGHATLSMVVNLALVATVFVGVAYAVSSIAA